MPRKSSVAESCPGPWERLPIYPPRVEALACRKLGLKPAPVSSQIIQRDVVMPQYFTSLAVLAGTLEKIAVEIRHLQRTEVLEAEEPFAKGQKGSSAMPHKKNPIGSENISGLARLVRSNSLAAMENMALWHERGHQSFIRGAGDRPGQHHTRRLYAQAADPHAQRAWWFIPRT